MILAFTVTFFLGVLVGGFMMALAATAWRADAQCDEMERRAKL